jgi:molybdopterin molybdotransferase
MALTFEQARSCILREVRSGLSIPKTQEVSVLDSAGRVLAEAIAADRPYPPFPRAARDGFAVRAQDLPGELRILGEARAGEPYSGQVGPGEAVEIMTGAALPDGCDAVVMVEYSVRNGNRVRIDRHAAPGDNFTPQGAEADEGKLVLAPYRRIDFTGVAVLAMVGRDRVHVCRKPRVAIIPTGDELVEVYERPKQFQIRNSNAWALAVQVERAGGIAEIAGIARDNPAATRALIERGLECDLVLLSGGVSAGKYDLVENVLADFGAEFFFDRVLIQPGQPLVFGRVQQKFFFGLPGNPASTMVTFEVFARAALELLGGIAEPVLPFTRAKLAADFRQKAGLTRFLPARLSPDGAEIAPEAHYGSGDVPALARTNAFLVTDPHREEWAAGDDIQVLMK